MSILQGPNAIDAVRAFRNEFGCGLMEAKAMWDRHRDLDKMRAAMLDGAMVETDRGRADRLERQLAKAHAALREIQSEIDGKADADIDGPNIYMRIDSICDRALEGK